MCSYIVEKAKLVGSAKGPNGWMRIDTANVYYDHPFHSPLDHALAIDFINEAEGGRERVAVELSAQSARVLVEKTSPPWRAANWSMARVGMPEPIAMPASSSWSDDNRLRRNASWT
jgi:Family of unknown function (DUF6295)